MLDSIREIMKYQKFDLAQMDLKNNPQAETMAHMKLFRAQRNLYISGFSLFLLMWVQTITFFFFFKKKKNKKKN